MNVAEKSLVRLFVGPRELELLAAEARRTLARSLPGDDLTLVTREFETVRLKAVAEQGPKTEVI